ncbi:NnrU family protein [Rhodovibrio salinarum]|uniref:NnrU domain-containing protein n=1 Tax=Rhodovibrio salinarum TaxID=1087 RepID=A0A934QF42_9PROT|nr:NnrU family protein [Rhodovibrio salinarum]MBK1695947.1 hypothetical protein [Rhodovibrio salinarum]
MTEFALAGLVFLAAHSLPSIPPARAWLRNTLGPRGYAVAFSVSSLVLLAWLLSAAIRAPYVALWTPPVWAYHLTLLLAPIGTVLVVAGLVRANPLSIGFVTRGFDPERPGLAGVTRHPVLWGFLFWAAGHIPANGDVVAVSLFGALGLFSLAGFWLVDRRHRRQLGARGWNRLSAAAPTLPFARGLPRFQVTDGVALLLGILAAAALLGGLHVWLFGVDPLIGLKLV